jgi:hypothetical protein
MQYNNIQKLIQDSSVLQTKICHAKSDVDFWWNIFQKQGGFDNYKMLSDAEAMLKNYEHQYKILEDNYNQLKNISSNNNNLVYAITIGSGEQTNTEPCESLWNRFINSADGKKCNDIEAYFERGSNGYIHIHAIVSRDQKWSMSINKLRQRYGKYQGKQHNFDVRRLIGIDQTKWRNYIKKDSEHPWNRKVNSFFL